jgi:hypothetical protein
METFLDYAVRYNALGFNVIPVIISKEGKKPALRSWKKWQSTPQSLDSINKLNWNNDVSGIGGINGIFHSLDFDKCTDEKFILRVAEELGINSWIVRTGYGYHLHFIVEDLGLIKLGLGNKGIYFFDSLDKKIVDHCELRTENCYTVLPPSNHFNGKQYQFLTELPEDRPQKISAKKILDVLQKYFIIHPSPSNKVKKESNNLINDIAYGVEEGQRHNTFIKYFGLLYNQGQTLDLITAQINNWNLRNIPPIEQSEVDKQIKDLWKRYSDGRDGIFYQFHNCLLGINDDNNLLLLKILCFSIVEFGGDNKIIGVLNLKKHLKKYHKECKEYVSNFERKYGKDQILRIGKNLFNDTLSGNMSYDEFSLYCAITSWLGRNKPYDTIANSILSFRAIGFKDEADYLIDENCKRRPLSFYKLNIARQKLKKRKLIDYGSPIKGKMNYYSTRIKEGDGLANVVGNRLLKKIEKEKAEKEVWTTWGNKIREAKKVAHS